jgi:hypothetical protein
MSVSNSRLSYLDAYEILDRALDRTVGVRVRQPDLNAATYLRMRLHQARKIDRLDNKSIFEPDHIMHGRSQYDVLIVTIDATTEGVFLYVTKIESKAAMIEDLGEPALPPPKDQPQLAPPIDERRHDELAEEPTLERRRI